MASLCCSSREYQNKAIVSAYANIIAGGKENNTKQYRRHDNGGGSGSGGAWTWNWKETQYLGFGFGAHNSIVIWFGWLGGHVHILRAGIRAG